MNAANVTAPPSMMQIYQAVTSPQADSFLADIRNKTADVVKMGVDSGHLDVHHFQAALFQAFGKESHGVVQANDTINYEKLDDLMGGLVAKKRQEIVPDNLFSSNINEQRQQLLHYLSSSQDKQFTHLFELSA